MVDISGVVTSRAQCLFVEPSMLRLGAEEGIFSEFFFAFFVCPVVLGRISIDSESPDTEVNAVQISREDLWFLILKVDRFGWIQKPFGPTSRFEETGADDEYVRM
jgi:hypothetical protein